MLLLSVSLSRHAHLIKLTCFLKRKWDFFCSETWLKLSSAKLKARKLNLLLTNLQIIQFILQLSKSVRNIGRLQYLYWWSDHTLGDWLLVIVSWSGVHWVYIDQKKFGSKLIKHSCIPEVRLDQNKVWIQDLRQVKAYDHYHHLCCPYLGLLYSCSYGI